MGCSQSKKTFQSQDPKVAILVARARKESEDGNVEKANTLYEKALNLSSTSDDDKNEIRKEMSTVMDVTKVVPKPKLVKKSTLKTKSFNASCNTLISELRDNKFQESSVIVTESLLNTDLRQLESIKTYFNQMFNLIMDINGFQCMDDGSKYQLKENILILLKDLAYASLHNNKPIVIDETTHQKMSESIETHEQWLKAEETNGISYTLFYFHLDYIKDIVSLMKSSNKKANKETRDSLFTNAGSIFEHCLALNISGVLFAALSLA